jgi:hypothetical protein
MSKPRVRRLPPTGDADTYSVRIITKGGPVEILVSCSGFWRTKQEAANQAASSIERQIRHVQRCYD